MGDPGTVVDSCVDVAIPDTARLGALTCVSAAPGLPSPTVRDPGKFLDIDMDQLTGSIPLIPPDRFRVGGTVSAIETSQTCLGEDVPHR